MIGIFQRLPLGVHAVAAAFVVLACGYALATPPWNNPDEPAHFNYIRQIAEKGELPVLEPGDWDGAHLDALKASKFAGPASVDGIDYEAHQPPLYYALASPLYLTTKALPLPQRVLALRGLSILLALALVYVTALLALQARPGSQAVATLAAGFVALLPMHTAMAAAINNDALANLLGAVLLGLAVAIYRTGVGLGAATLLGVLMGLAVLTKTTLYALLPLVLLAAASGWRRRGVLPYGLGAAITLAILVGGWWVVRNALVYGWLDPLATARHDEVVVGQLRTNEAGPEVTSGMLTTLRNSFWGDFGWMGIPLHDPIYQAYQVVLGLGLLGALVFLISTKHERGQLANLMFLAAAVLAVALALLGYNLKFVQPQGRYLFPALAAIAVFFALGISTILRAELVPSRFRTLGLSLVLLGAGALAIEAAGPLIVGLPRRMAYGLVVVAALAAPLGVRSRPEWREPVGATALCVALGWADLALLLGVVTPAFR